MKSFFDLNFSQKKDGRKTKLFFPTSEHLRKFSVGYIKSGWEGHSSSIYSSSSWFHPLTLLRLAAEDESVQLHGFAAQGSPSFSFLLRNAKRRRPKYDKEDMSPCLTG